MTCTTLALCLACASLTLDRPLPLPEPVPELPAPVQSTPEELARVQREGNLQDAKSAKRTGDLEAKLAATLLEGARLDQHRVKQAAKMKVIGDYSDFLKVCLHVNIKFVFAVRRYTGIRLPFLGFLTMPLMEIPDPE